MSFFIVFLGENNRNARLSPVCNGKDQNNEKFWLEFLRNTEDFYVKIKKSKFILETGKYKKMLELNIFIL